MIIKISKPREAIYNFYKQNNPSSLVTISIFCKIYSGYLKYLMQKVLDGYDVKLGSGETLGTLAIRGKIYKPKIKKNEDGTESLLGIPIDWGNSRKIWKEVADSKGITLQEYIDSTTSDERQKAYHFNDHSDGITNKVLWTHADGYLDKYNFIVTKGPNGMGRKITKLTNQGKEYLEVVDRIKTKKPNNGQVKTS